MLAFEQDSCVPQIQVSWDSSLLLLAGREMPPVLACISAPLPTQEALQLLAAFQLLELLR